MLLPQEVAAPSSFVWKGKPRTSGCERGVPGRQDRDRSEELVARPGS